MNIHEYQAKELLKKFGAPVPNGVHGDTSKDLLNKSKLLKTEKYVLKAQIHSGGRGKAGGIKITNSLEEWKLSLPPLKIIQLPDFIERQDASTVTFGLDS